MGNQPTKKEQQPFQVHQQVHQRFQTVKVITNSQQDQQSQLSVMHIQHPLESENKYQEWIKDMQSIKDYKTKEVIFFPIKHGFKAVGMCGSGGIVQLQYEFYEFVLKTQVENRFKLKKNFLETEIWYLLYSIVQAGSKFELLKRKIGNIHPNNILINQNGQIKLISTCSLPGQLNNYELLLQQAQNNQNQLNIYLAPEQINHDLIQKGSYPSHVNPSVAEVFSIGLTILSCGTLENCNQLYNHHPYSLKPQGLGALLRSFRQKYSDYLYQFISKMLSLIPDNRIKCSAIAAQLQSYEDDILDLEPFVPNIKRNFQPPLQNVNQVYRQTASQPHHLSYQPQQQYNPLNRPADRHSFQPLNQIYQQPAAQLMPQQRQTSSVYATSYSNKPATFHPVPGSRY